MSLMYNLSLDKSQFSYIYISINPPKGICTSILTPYVCRKTRIPCICPAKMVKLFKPLQSQIPSPLTTCFEQTKLFLSLLHARTSKNSEGNWFQGYCLIYWNDFYDNRAEQVVRTKGPRHPLIVTS